MSQNQMVREYIKECICSYSLEKNENGRMSVLVLVADETSFFSRSEWKDLGAFSELLEKAEQFNSTLCS